MLKWGSVFREAILRGPLRSRGRARGRSTGRVMRGDDNRRVQRPCGMRSLPISLNAGSRRNLTCARRRCRALPSRRGRRLARRRHRNTGRERPSERTWGHVSRSRGGSLTPQMLCSDIWRGGINRRRTTRGSEHHPAIASSDDRSSCSQAMKVAGGILLMPLALPRASSQGGPMSPLAVSPPFGPLAHGPGRARSAKEGDKWGDNSIPVCCPLCRLPSER